MVTADPIFLFRIAVTMLSPWEYRSGAYPQENLDDFALRSRHVWWNRDAVEWIDPTAFPRLPPEKIENLRSLKAEFLKGVDDKFAADPEEVLAVGATAPSRFEKGRLDPVLRAVPSADPKWGRSGGNSIATAISDRAEIRSWQNESRVRRIQERRRSELLQNATGRYPHWTRAVGRAFCQIARCTAPRRLRNQHRIELFQSRSLETAR